MQYVNYIDIDFNPQNMHNIRIDSKSSELTQVIESGCLKELEKKIPDSTFSYYHIPTPKCLSLEL